MLSKKLSEPTPNVSNAQLSFLYVSLFSKDYDPDFTHKLDNKLLGMPVVQRDEVVEILRGVLETN